MDRLAMRSLMQTDGEPLWRSLMTVAANRARTESAIMAALTDQGEAAGPDRVRLWAVAFEAIDRETNPVVSTDPALLDVAVAVDAVPTGSAHLMLARHVGRFTDGELARLASTTVEAVERSLSLADDAIDRAEALPAERWSALLDQVPVPDLDPLADRAARDRLRWRRPAMTVAAGLLLATAVAVGATRGDSGIDIGQSLTPALDPSSRCRAAAVAELIDPERSPSNETPNNETPNERRSLDDLLFQTDLVATGRVTDVAADPAGLRVRLDRLTAADDRPLSDEPLPPSLELSVPASFRDWDGSLDVAEDALVLLARSGDGWRLADDDGIFVACDGDAVSLLDPSPEPMSGSFDELTEGVDAARSAQTVLGLTAAENEAAQGGIVLPDERRLWLRLPKGLAVQRLAIRPGAGLDDADSADRIALRGPGLAIGLRPDGCNDGAASASTATGSVASLAAGALVLCLNDGDLALDIDVEGGTSTEDLAQLIVAVAAPHDVGLDTAAPDTDLESPPYVHDAGRGRILGLDQQSFQLRWSTEVSTEVSTAAEVATTTGDRVILAGADDELTALDRANGETVWRTEATGVRQVVADPNGNVLYLIEGDGGSAALDPVLALRDGATGLRRWVVPTPAGISRSIVGVGADAVILDRREGAAGAAWSVFVVADENGLAVERWRVDGTRSGESADRPVQALTDGDRGVVLVLAADKLFRFDQSDGRLRWEASVGFDPELRLTGIWANTATVTTGDRALTLSLTDGTFLPP